MRIHRWYPRLNAGASHRLSIPLRSLASSPKFPRLTGKCAYPGGGTEGSSRGGKRPFWMISRGGKRPFWMIASPRELLVYRRSLIGRRSQRGGDLTGRYASRSAFIGSIPCRPPRREPAGDEAGSDQHRGDGGERQRIRRRDAEEDVLDDAGGGGGGEQSHSRRAGADERGALPEYEDEDGSVSGSQGHADADLSPALRHRIAEQAVETEGGE